MTTSDVSSAAPATLSGSHTQTGPLQANALGFNALLWQALSHIGPAIGLITSAPFVALYAGASLPLSLFLAGVVALLVGSSVAQLSRHLPSAGGYYTFAGRALGPFYGYMTGWIYFLFDPFILSVGTPFAMYYLQEAVKAEWGIFIPWELTTVITILGLGLLTFVGVKRSLRATIIFGIAEIIIIVGMAIGLIVKGAHGQPIGPSFDPRSSPTGLHGVALGLIYSILAYAGFESVAPLAEESKNPRRNLPRAIFISVLVGMFVFVFAGYATVVGWGTSGMATTFPNANNPYYTLAHTLFPIAAGLVVLAMINSVLGADITSQNAAIRVWYSMGRTGVMPGPLGWIHRNFRTPWVAIVMQMLISLAASLGLGEILGPVNTFGFLGLMVTCALIITYIMGNVSVFFYYRREHPEEFNLLLLFLLPAVAVVMLVITLGASVYPLPTYPTRIAMYIVVAWLILGAAVTMWMLRNRPEQLAKSGQAIFEEGEPVVYEHI
jgi:amino acid transporter